MSWFTQLLLLLNTLTGPIKNWIAKREADKEEQWNLDEAKNRVKLRDAKDTAERDAAADTLNHE